MIETTTQTWGSRIFGSIKSVFLGFILFIGSFIVLWYNEGRTVKTSKGLTEGVEQVISVSSENVNQENEGRLIHLNGIISTNEKLTDREFNIETQALRLRRIVEMYQWVEVKNSKTKENMGGSKTTTTEYTYEKEWRKGVVNSSKFKVQGHDNPQELPYKEWTKQASKPLIGAFNVSQNQLSRLTDFTALPIHKLDTIIKNFQLLKGGIIYAPIDSTSTINNPKIGDVKISYETINEGPYSIVAKQHSNTLESFRTSTETTIQMITSGIVSAENMFHSEQESNKVLGWVLRFVGFLMMFFGLYLIFRPIAMVGNIVPIVGSLLGIGIGLFAGLVSFIFSFITIAFAWIFYRPIIGIGLLVVASVGVYFLIKMKNKKQNNNFIENSDI